MNECLALFLASCVTWSSLASLSLSFQVYKMSKVMGVCIASETVHKSLAWRPAHSKVLSKWWLTLDYPYLDQQSKTECAKENERDLQKGCCVERRQQFRPDGWNQERLLSGDGIWAGPPKISALNTTHLQERDVYTPIICWPEGLQQKKIISWVCTVGEGDVADNSPWRAVGIQDNKGGGIGAPGW